MSQSPRRDGGRLPQRRITRLAICGVIVLLAWTEGASFLVPRRTSTRSEQRWSYTVPVAAVAPATAHVVAQPVALDASVRPPNVDHAGRRALIVGINNAPGSPPLPGSLADAANVRTALLNYGFRSGDVTVLTESEATRGAILGELDRLAARSSSSGITVFAISTHSYRGPNGFLFRTWDGHIGAHELSSRLGRVRGRLWSLLSMCYAGGYALPGITGKDRIAVFSSSAQDKSWQLGDAGSFIVLYMVRYAMIDGEAPESVEAAFAYARHEISYNDRRGRPLMSDGVDGELELGPRPDPPAHHDEGDDPKVQQTTEQTPAPSSPPDETIVGKLVPS